MATTTIEEQYKRLRAFLNPFIKGAKVDAVLTALASGNAAYLINNVRAVNDQLYIATASGQYLDARLAEAGIVRPPNVGLSDDVFRQIGIQVKNRKQVRDLINNLLDAIFGDEFVRASNPARAVQPYALQDGDTLLVNFDDKNTVPIKFTSAEFNNIAAASAQEVADAITRTLRNLGFSGTAIAKDDGNGPYVEILSDTIGPASSVTVMGGSAQNKLLFDAVAPAGGNSSTQWTITLQPGGILQFTWTGGANPQLGKVDAGNYVNIFGGGFASTPNEGSYTIIKSVGGAAGSSYFQIANPLGVPGVVTQGTNTAVLFYIPIKKTLGSRQSFAAVYQTQGKLLQIFLPSSTKVIRRSRIGSAHMHSPPQGTFIFKQQPSNGDQFGICNGHILTVGVDFVLGGNISATVDNLVAAANLIPGILAIANTGDTALILNQSLANTLTITYSGINTITASGPTGDNFSLFPNQQGPYMYDTAQPFTISKVGTLLTQDLDGTMSRVINVGDSSGFPDTLGYFILGYGTSHQEGPIPYIARPSNNTLLISPAYTIQKFQPNGTDVALIAKKAPVNITRDGLNYPFYITDVVSGRIYAQDLINSVAATGINIVFTVLYPNDIGLGKWGTDNSENPIIWGA